MIFVAKRPCERPCNVPIGRTQASAVVLVATSNDRTVGEWLPCKAISLGLKAPTSLPFVVAKTREAEALAEREGGCSCAVLCLTDANGEMLRFPSRLAAQIRAREQNHLQLF